MELLIWQFFLGRNLLFFACFTFSTPERWSTTVVPSSTDEEPEKLSVRKYKYSVTLQRYSRQLLYHWWPSSGYFLFNLPLNSFPGVPLQKDSKSKENYLRPMDNIAWLHIWLYYCTFESAERTYLQPSSIRSTDIKIWSLSHWYFWYLFFWLFFLRACLTLCSILIRLGFVKLRFRVGRSSCKIGNGETSDDLGSSS